MKKPFLILSALLMSISLFAQDGGKLREVGLTTSNLSNFGLTYRVGTSEKLWRFNVADIRANLTGDDSDNGVTSTTSEYGIGFRIGREKRKSLGSNLESRLGVDFSGNFSSSSYRTKSGGQTGNVRNQSEWGLGVNLVAGLNYVIKEKFVIGAELLPGLAFRQQNVESSSNGTDFSNQSISRISLAGNNRLALLSFAVRF